MADKTSLAVAAGIALLLVLGVLTIFSGPLASLFSPTPAAPIGGGAQGNARP